MLITTKLLLSRIIAAALFTGTVAYGELARSQDLGIWRTASAAVAPTTKVYFITSCPWTVPSYWTSTNKLEGIGAGASGGSGTASVSTGGSQAGGYSSISNVSGLTPGGSVNCQIGVGGATNIVGGGGNGNAGTATWMRIDGGSTAPTTTAQGFLAAGGAANAGVTGGSGAQSNIGTVVFTGGSGGATSGSLNSAGGSGGAASSGGNGSAGGGDGTGYSGGGGGGAGGSLSTVGANGGGSASPGGIGGTGGLSGTAGGAGALVTTAPGNGSNGSGGGGGYQTGADSFGGNGGAGVEYTQTSNGAHAGAGGGGGGGGYGGSNLAKGGAGGLYGGAGGGSGAAGLGGAGGAGIIIATAYSYTGPLDIVSGATAFYSLRAGSGAIAAAGTQPIIAMRRGSDNATCTAIVATSGSVDFTVGAPCSGATVTAFCASTTCYVTTWYDQSGNGNNLAQPTAANQPSLIFGCLGTRPCISFNGAGDGLIDTSGTFGLGAFTVDVMAEYNSVSGSESNRIFSQDNISSNFGLLVELTNGNPSQHMVLNSTEVDLNGAFSLSTGTWYNITSGWNLTTQFVYENATQDANSPVAATGTMRGTGTELAVGTDSGGGDHVNGYVTEVGKWPSVWASANITAACHNKSLYYGSPSC